jgi:alpha,alpha-trehalose phosphorylase
VITHRAFESGDWSLRERELDLERLAQSESIFALSNGHLGLRGNLDEGEPAALPGTYLNGFFEQRPLPYAEAGYGYPEAGQTVVNVTDGKLMRLMVDDELFDVRYGRLRKHERELDLRAGTLTRTVEWESPTGVAVRIVSERIVSFVQRGVAAIRYTVELRGKPARLVVSSELIANQTAPDPSADPRAAAVLREPLEPQFADGFDDRLVLAHRTKGSALTIAVATRHVIDGPDNTSLESFARDNMGRVAITADVDAGATLSVVKLLAYGWSAHRSAESVRTQVLGAVSEAHHSGWRGLIDSQRAYLDAFWDRAEVELDGDDELQLAVRFGLFHVLQASARGEGRAIPAKGLTGPGYDGHAFWDSESYVLPPLTYLAPEAARDALRWRHSTLPLARDRARQLELRGAAFPWRTISGEECSAYWPAGTAAFHVNADIADAVRRYCNATEDEAFEREAGFELLVETARLWAALGHRDDAGRFRIDGVTGPDEYSALADNNVYTNLMAARNLRTAAWIAEHYPDRAGELEVTPQELGDWRDAAEHVFVPYDEALGVHPQAESFTEHARWDFEATGPDRYPLQQYYPYFELYRRQVVKQADLVLAMVAFSDRFSQEQKARNFAYYEPLTVRDSSLSASVQAIASAETGHLDLAYDYAAEAALIDLDDTEHNVRDGLHIASLAGAWVAFVIAFGGVRDHGGETLTFAPRLPPALSRLSFRLLIRRTLLGVEVKPQTATYRVTGGPLELSHHGQATKVAEGKPVTLPIPPSVQPARVSQPPGRAPARRQAQRPEQSPAGHGRAGSESLTRTRTRKSRS